MEKEPGKEDQNISDELKVQSVVLHRYRISNPYV